MDFKEIYRRSISKPEEFWREISNDIFWFKKPTKILNSNKPPFYKWFEDGVTNSCYNALDFHIDEGRGDKTALIYDSPITGNKGKFSFKQLKDKVSKLKLLTYTKLLFAIKTLERAGDHICNIAEEIHFIVTGDDISTTKKPSQSIEKSLEGSNK